MSVEVLFAASLAVTVIVLVPMESETEEIDQLVVPLTAPQEEPLTVQATEVTPILSEAVPERSTVEADVE